MGRGGGREGGREKGNVGEKVCVETDRLFWWVF